VQEVDQQWRKEEENVVLLLHCKVNLAVETRAVPFVSCERLFHQREEELLLIDDAGVIMIQNVANSEREAAVNDIVALKALGRVHDVQLELLGAFPDEHFRENIFEYVLEVP